MQFVERNFRKFGQIEHIELLSKELGEAYVTFVNDVNAYVALAHNEVQSRRCTQTFNIQPADTWVQPPSASTNNPHESNNNTNQIDDELSPAFFMLNEFCILEIFKYLDFDSLVSLSMVCQMFHRLLHQHCFPHRRSISIRNDKSSIPMPLAKVRQSLICIGPYLTELYFKWHDYDQNNRLQRFLDKIGQLVGPNVRCVRFHDTLLDESHIQAIRPLLKRLETLEMIVYNPDFDLDLDFCALCPNLRRLKLLENMQLIHVADQPWPTLEYFSIVGNEYMELNAFASFLTYNPQLQCLKFTGYSVDDRLQAVAKFCKNLRKLTVFTSFPNLCASNIGYLSSLQHLTKLSLIDLVEADLNGILECLIRFTGLRSIKLFLSDDGSEIDSHYEPNQQKLISIAQELPHLEKFCTRYVKWKESTILDFIQHASQLNALHIHWCDLSIITNSMVWKMVKILQLNRPQAAVMPPLKLYVNASDVIELQMIKEPEILRHLIVHTECHHIEHAE